MEEADKRLLADCRALAWSLGQVTTRTKAEDATVKEVIAKVTDRLGDEFDAVTGQVVPRKLDFAEVVYGPGGLRWVATHSLSQLRTRRPKAAEEFDKEARPGRMVFVDRETVIVCQPGPGYGEPPVPPSDPTPKPATVRVLHVPRAALPASPGSGDGRRYWTEGEGEWAGRINVTTGWLDYVYRDSHVTVVGSRAGYYACVAYDPGRDDQQAADTALDAAFDKAYATEKGKADGPTFLRLRIGSRDNASGFIESDYMSTAELARHVGVGREVLVDAKPGDWLRHAGEVIVRLRDNRGLALQRWG